MFNYQMGSKMYMSMLRLLQWLIGQMQMKRKDGILRKQNDIDGHQAQKEKEICIHLLSGKVTKI